MICNLCRTNKTLLKKSHIIPDFMYQFVYDDHWLVLVAPANPDIRISRVPTGSYDKYLLCKNCDNGVIGKFESYGSIVLFNRNSTGKNGPIIEQVKLPPEGRLLHLASLDYKKFRLFILSILWRASISEQPFFKNISLTQDAEDELRKMILENDSGDSSKYQIIIIAPQVWNDLNNVIGQPHKFDHDGTTGYIFLMAGIYFLIFSNASTIPKELHKFCMDASGELYIPQLNPADYEKFLKGYFGMA